MLYGASSVATFQIATQKEKSRILAKKRWLKMRNLGHDVSIFVDGNCIFI